MAKDDKAKKEQMRAVQLEKLLDMPFKARFILGGCTMEIGDIISLGQGAVLELDTMVNEHLQIWVNDRLIAKGDSVVVNERYGARIVEIASKEERLKDMADVD